MDNQELRNTQKLSRHAEIEMRTEKEEFVKNFLISKLKALEAKTKQINKLTDERRELFREYDQLLKKSTEEIFDENKQTDQTIWFTIKGADRAIYNP